MVQITLEEVFENEAGNLETKKLPLEKEDIIAFSEPSKEDIAAGMEAGAKITLEGGETHFVAEEAERLKTILAPPAPRPEYL